MDTSDRELSCASCGQGFTFTAGEQAYFAQNGLQPPRRCKNCRAQRKNQGDTPQPAARGPRRDGNGNGNGPSVRARNLQDSAAQARFGYKLPSPEDPNGYRAPGFQTEHRSAYTVDYAALPKDDDDEADGQTAMLGLRAGTGDRFGLRTNAPPSAPRTARAGGAFRAPPPRRTDRAGTDPNAYRAPGFAPQHATPAPRAEGVGHSDAEPAGSNRRARRAQRMRHEATCMDCGVAAMVPFQPGPDRPAYCKACYQTRKANGTAPIPPRAADPTDTAPGENAHASHGDGRPVTAPELGGE